MPTKAKTEWEACVPRGQPRVSCCQTSSPYRQAFATFAAAFSTRTTETHTRMNTLLSTLALLAATAISVQAQLAQPAATPPAITSHPAHQTADYGADVTLTVGASGTPLYYQWQKDGAPLADYANVAGANGAALTLVGVAQSDAGAYTVVVGNSSGSVTSSPAILTVNPVTVFSEHFESGTLERWTALPRSSRLTNSADQNHTSGGSRSALLTSSRDKMYHNLGMKLPGRVTATFWLYDDGGNQTRYCGELRGYTGPGHAKYVPPGGMKQLLAIGRYGLSFGSKNTGALASEKVDPECYQGRVYRGKNTGWFNLDAPGAPRRSVGWHQFQIDRAADGTNVNFYVDGVLGRTITGAAYAFLDSVTIGSVGLGSTPGNVWFDDVQVESFPWRFDWQSLDSAGTGLFDWMRARETGTNLAISAITTVSHVAGQAAHAALGRWAVENQAAASLDLRGSLEYVLTAPTDAAYRLEVEACGHADRHRTPDLSLLISIDGEYLGRFPLPCGSQTNSFVRCFTPFIHAGPHTVCVDWDNAASRSSLDVQAVRLQALHGSGDRENGRAQWMENRLRAQNGLELAPESTPVSPVCVEGRGQYLSMMTLLAGAADPLSPIQVQPGPGHRWYANVPLSPDGPTRIEVSYQNGGLMETNDIVWEVTNLLLADNPWLRRGDALLLTALPAAASAGTVSITVVGVTNYTTDAATPVAHRFDQPGTFTIVGAFSGGRTKASRTITVRVIDASLDSPAAWVGKRRSWTCTNLPPEVALDWDPRLKIRELPAPSALGANARQYSLITDAAQPRYIVARLGRHGPILAATAVQGFRLFSTADTYLQLVREQADGSQLVETAFILSPVLPDITVGLKIMVSGVTFEDGTVTKMLAPADFDELGTCRVRFVRAAGLKTSVCHITKAYQDGLLIGWPGNEK